MEKWLSIPGFPDYEASDQGNIRSLDRVVRRKDTGTPVFYKGCVLKPFERRGQSGDGNVYRAVTIHGRNMRIGALVLLAHRGARPPGQQCRHLDDNSLDDRLDNLAWGTPSQNSMDAYRNGRVRLAGELNGHSRLKEVDVMNIRAAIAAKETTQRSLAKQYGVAESTISAIVRGQTWARLPSGGRERGSAER